MLGSGAIFGITNDNDQIYQIHISLITPKHPGPEYLSYLPCRDAMGRNSPADCFEKVRWSIIKLNLKVGMATKNRIVKRVRRVLWM